MYYSCLTKIYVDYIILQLNKSYQFDVILTVHRR